MSDINILSIDVGIKNLALCFFSVKTNQNNNNSFTILKWDIINISNVEEKKVMKCNDCKQNATHVKTNIYFCNKHVKKFPCYDEKELNKQPISKLKDKCKELNIELESLQGKCLKKNVLEKLKNYFENNYAKKINIIKNNNKASTIDLIQVAKNISVKIPLFLNNMPELHHVLIENQIGPLAVRMKSVQCMLTQYFVLKNTETKITYVSSIHKLENIDSELTLTYSDRKKNSIKTCKKIINEKFNDYVSFFNEHNKKDDLADSFLQGLWFINSSKLTV